MGLVRGVVHEFGMRGMVTVARVTQAGQKRWQALWDFVLRKNAWVKNVCWCSVSAEERGSTGRRVQRTLLGQLVRHVTRCRCQDGVTAA